MSNHDPATATEVVRDVERLYEKLAATPDLAPDGDADATFRDLVALATRPAPDDLVVEVLADPGIRRLAPRLHALCADGEAQLERVWARRITASADPRATTLRFPYYDNYVRLVRLEQHAVTALADRPPRRLAFVGSGPLPLSSLLFRTTYGYAVDNVDSAPSACASAGELVGSLGVDGVRFRCADVLATTDLADYDLVLLAAMVGLHRADKARVLRHLHEHMAPGALLLARSAHALRTLLYPRLEYEDLADFRILAEVHPHTDVVNSAIIAQKPPLP